LTFAFDRKPEFSFSGLEVYPFACLKRMQFQKLIPTVGVTSVNLCFPAPPVKFIRACQRHSFLNPVFGTDRLLKFLSISQIPNRNSFCKLRCKPASSVAWIFWLLLRTITISLLHQRTFKTYRPCFFWFRSKQFITFQYSLRNIFRFSFPTNREGCFAYSNLESFHR
jgi:hypothetical protein